MGASDPILIPSSLLEGDDALPIVRLPHPRTRLPALFVIRPDQGIWEVQSVSPPSHATRSWFYQPDDQDQPDEVLSKNGGRLLYVTPMDPFFLLLGLFFNSSVSLEELGTEKNSEDRKLCFEQTDVMLDRAQEEWSFSDGSGKPSSDDIEIFAAAALRPEKLAKLFTSLQQDSETILWRRDRDKVIQEIRRKVDYLKKAGIDAGHESRTFWSRLAIKEGLLLVDQASDEAPSLIQEIYTKVALEMIEGYIPTSLQNFIQDQNIFEFSKLKQLKHTQEHIDLSAKIGRNQGKENDDGSKVNKPQQTKKIKQQSSFTPGTRTLGDMWGRQTRANDSNSSSLPKSKKSKTS